MLRQLVDAELGHAQGLGGIDAFAFLHVGEMHRRLAAARMSGAEHISEPAAPPAFGDAGFRLLVTAAPLCYWITLCYRITQCYWITLCRRISIVGLALW